MSVVSAQDSPEFNGFAIEERNFSFVCQLQGIHSDYSAPILFVGRNPQLNRIHNGKIPVYLSD